MELQRTLEWLRARPGALGVDGSFGQTAAFIDGINAGQGGEFLRGFREWLVVQLGDGVNLTWRGLVLRLAVQGGHSEGVVNLSVEDDKKAIDILFDQLGRFLVARELADGMLKIYDSYLKWLRSQEWYTPDSPSYLE